MFKKRIHNLSSRLIASSKIKHHSLEQLTQQYWPYAVMLIVTILIVGPLYARGYILKYDMVFSPYIDVNFDAIRNGYSLWQSVPLTYVLKILGVVIPLDIVQKFVISLALFLSIFSIYRSVPVQSRLARLFGGLMYAINPFTYDRFLAGHWSFLLAYSLTPFALRAILDLFYKPNRQNLLKAILIWSGIVFINAHHLIIIGLIFSCLLMVFLIKAKWHSLLYSLACLTGVFILNGWWILPALFSGNQFQFFGLDQFYVFTTQTDFAHGIWFNILSLQGFWYTDWNSIKHYYSFWPLVVLIWLLPVFLGLGYIRAYLTKNRILILALLLASFLAVIFIAGPNPHVYSLNNWFYANIPGLSGLREPQKLSAIIALTYALLAVYGLNHLLISRSKKIATLVIIICFISLAFIGRPMVWGFSGQMKTYQYPPAWYEFHDLLDHQQPKQKVLLLPWDIYVNNTITNNLVANPARSFFTEYAVVSQRMLIPDIQDIETPSHSAITLALQQKNRNELLLAASNLDAKYIMITEDYNDGQYDWLIDNDPYLIKIIDSPDLLVYRVDKFP